MPKVATKQNVHGVKKKANDGTDNNKPPRVKKTNEGTEINYRLPRVNRSLPPLPSQIPKLNTQGEMHGGRQPSNKVQNGQNGSIDNSGKKPENYYVRTRGTNKRRSKQGGSLNPAASIQKKGSTKPKLVDGDLIDFQPKTKPKKKGLAKPKLLDKHLQEADVSGGEVTFRDSNSGETVSSPQWTNIAKKVQIHKPTKSKARLQRRKDANKRKKTEYVIENTWIPRDPGDSSIQQKVHKKSKATNNKIKESRKATKEGTSNISVDICKVETSEAENDMAVGGDLLKPSVSVTEINLLQIQTQVDDGKSAPPMKVG